MGKWLEPVSNELRAKIDAILSSDDEELIRIPADLDREGDFGNQWVVVTTRRVLVYENESADKPIDVPIPEITRARTEALVGGGQLVIERHLLPTVSVLYSNTEAERFSEVARGLEQLRKGEKFFIRTELDRTRCGKCGRLLPEKNGLCPACVRRLATLGRIAGYMKPYKMKAILMASASIAMTLSELIPPLISRRIVDDVFGSANGSPAPMDARLTLLGYLVIGLIAVRMMSWSSDVLRGWVVSWLSARITADIRSQLYRRLEMLSLQFYDKRQVGGLMSRVTRDSGMLQGFLVDGLPYLVTNLMMIVGILFFLLWMNWRLTLYILVPIPLLLLWGVLCWKRMRGLFNTYGQNWSRLGTRLNEALNGIRVVKAFTRENQEIAAFEKTNRSLMFISRRTARTWFLMRSTMSLITGFGGLIIWMLGGMDVLGGQLTLGTLLAFYSYMWLLYGPIQWLGQVNNWMTRAFAGAERIFEVIDTPAEAYDNPNAIAMPDMKGQVTFSDVTFGYDKSKPVLNDMNLVIAQGEMIGLVGKSGVGKTTTVNLISRFYEVDRGTISIDGIDIRDIRLEDLRRQIGIVLQDPFLFSGTIAENIGYGNPAAKFEDIVKAARAANAHDFILAKPNGYDTILGERGISLSGGERQRVSLARAVLHNPKILVLDEATSSVDVLTEKQIQEAIGRLIKGRPTIAIAHRLSTLKNADRLVILDAGRIAKIGTHDELMEKKGLFFRLVNIQREASEI
ncbi:MAG: ABC transporter ATP-binding protein, partial [bacterium]|nr:ABC transporter ATP-binding protein [bacterium]